MVWRSLGDEQLDSPGNSRALALHAATLEWDAVRLLENIGIHKIPAYLFEVVASLPGETYGYRDSPNSVAKGGDRHLKSALQALTFDRWLRFAR
jgi:hypothetical protein